MALTIFFTLTPTGRVYTRAALLVTDLLSSSPNSLLHIVTKPAESDTIVLPHQDGAIEARLYRPASDSRHGAMILVLGYPSNIDDPQLNRLADDLARLGLVVLIPRLPGLHTGQLGHHDVDALVTAFQWLTARPEVNPNHIGFGGFCIGGSLALVAAEDPRINEAVTLVNVFGGYYDLLSLLRAIASHSARYGGREYPWRPTRQTVALFTQNVLLNVDDPVERAILVQCLEGEETFGQLPETLSPVASLAYALLTTTDPTEVDALLAQIPPDKLAQMAMISPSAGVERLKAKVFIMHDVSDPHIPVTESYRLADAITDPHQRVCAQFSLFEHVRPTRPLDRLTLVWEGARLFVYLSRVLAEIMPSN